MRPDSHEIFGRRRSRNRGLGLVLGAFVVLVFAVTVVKLTEGQPMQGFDHKLRPAIMPEAATQTAPATAVTTPDDGG